MMFTNLDMHPTDVVEVRNERSDHFTQRLGRGIEFGS